MWEWVRVVAYLISSINIDVYERTRRVMVFLVFKEIREKEKKKRLLFCDFHRLHLKKKKEKKKKKGWNFTLLRSITCPLFFIIFLHIYAFV